MIMVSIVLAVFVCLAVLCLMAITRSYFKTDVYNDVLILFVFLVSFIIIESKLSSYAFCESSVIKICPSDRTEYIR